MIRTKECFDEPPTIAAGSAVLIFAISIGFHHLEQLQMTCYPFAGVWCHLYRSEEPFGDVSKRFLEICDAFLVVHEAFPFIESRVILRESGATAFTLRTPTGVCNRAGVLTSENKFQRTSAGLNLSATGVYVPAYNGPPVKAKSISSSRVGVVQGFEFRMMHEVASILDFTFTVTFGGVHYGIKPQPGTYWSGFVLDKLITRSVHFVYGDLSILHPREQYVDFAYVHDVDVAAFYAKLDVKPFSGGQLLHIIDHAASASFYACVVLFSTWFAVHNIFYGSQLSSTNTLVASWRFLLPHFLLAVVESIWYFGSFIVQPRRGIFRSSTAWEEFSGMTAPHQMKSRSKASGIALEPVDAMPLEVDSEQHRTGINDSPKVSSWNRNRDKVKMRTATNKYQMVFLLIIWNFSMLLLSKCFECKLVSLMTKPTVQGKCDTFREISRVLKAVPRSRIYTAPHFKPVFDRTIARLPKNSPEHRLQLYMEAYDSREFVNYWRKSRVAFIFAESIHVRRDVWKFNMGDFSYQSRQTPYNTYQAIGFQKGCSLRVDASRVIKRLVETGHLIKFKKEGGIHLGNRIRMPFTERPLTLESFGSLILMISIAYGISVVFLLAEIFNEYQFITPTAFPSTTFDMATAVKFLQRKHLSEARRKNKTSESFIVDTNLASQRCDTAVTIVSDC